MRGRVLAAVVLLLVPVSVRAQDAPAMPGWVAQVSVGYAGFLDDSTKNFLLLGGSVRKQLTPRVSIGPDIAVMSNHWKTRMVNVVATANVVYEFGSPGDGRVVPFVVGGLGMFWNRDRVRQGIYWSSDPSFTAGAGLRARVNDSFSAAVEYRVGWEPHQRLSGSAVMHW